MNLNITPEQLHALAVSYNPDLAWADSLEAPHPFFHTQAKSRGVVVGFFHDPNWLMQEVAFVIYVSGDGSPWDMGGDSNPTTLCEFHTSVDKISPEWIALLPPFKYFLDKYGGNWND